MPIESNTAEYNYTGDGVSTAFQFPSRFLQNGDLLVGLNGALQAAGYTVSGAGAAGGGTVTFAVAPAAGVRVTLLRKPEPSQLLDFVNGQTVLEGVLDNAFDKLTMLVQYLLRGLSRAVLVGELSGQTAPLLDTTALTPGRVLLIDAANKLVSGPSAADVENAQENADAAIDAAAAALASQTSASASAVAAAASAASITKAALTATFPVLAGCSDIDVSPRDPVTGKRFLIAAWFGLTVDAVRMWEIDTRGRLVTTAPLWTSGSDISSPYDISGMWTAWGYDFGVSSYFNAARTQYEGFSRIYRITAATGAVTLKRTLNTFGGRGVCAYNGVQGFMFSFANEVSMNRNTSGQPAVPPWNCTDQSIMVCKLDTGTGEWTGGASKFWEYTRTRGCVLATIADFKLDVDTATLTGMTEHCYYYSGTTPAELDGQRYTPIGRTVLWKDNTDGFFPLSSPTWTWENYATGYGAVIPTRRGAYVLQVTQRLDSAEPNVVDLNHFEYETRLRKLLPGGATEFVGTAVPTANSLGCGWLEFDGEIFVWIMEACIGGWREVDFDKAKCAVYWLDQDKEDLVPVAGAFGSGIYGGRVFAESTGEAFAALAEGVAGHRYYSNAAVLQEDTTTSLVAARVFSLGDIRTWANGSRSRVETISAPAIYQPRARLSRVNATTLQLEPRAGSGLVIGTHLGDEIVASGTLTVTNAGTAANTLYDVILERDPNTGANAGKPRLRLVPASAKVRVNGLLRLASEPRLLVYGRVRTDASAQFVFTQARKLVLSEYEREFLIVSAALDATTAALSNPALAEVSAAMRVEFLTHGGDHDISQTANAYASVQGDNVATAVGLGTTLGTFTSDRAFARFRAAFGGYDAQISGHEAADTALAAGYWFASMRSLRVGGSGNYNIVGGSGASALSSIRIGYMG